MTEDRTFLLQKHQTVHKALITLLIAPIVPTTWISVNFSQFLEFLMQNSFFTIAIALVIIAIPYGLVILFLYYKCDEYEHLIKHHTVSMPSGMQDDPHHIRIL